MRNLLVACSPGEGDQETRGTAEDVTSSVGSRPLKNAQKHGGEGGGGGGGVKEEESGLYLKVRGIFQRQLVSY